MDYEFISKAGLIIGLYFLVNYFYKNIDWHSISENKEKKLKDYLTYIFIIIFALAFLYSLVAFIFIVFLKESLNYIEKRNYWEQIVLFLGIIVFYFYYRLSTDEKKFKDNKKSSIIEEQKSKIYQLKEKIKSLEKKLNNKI